MVGVAVKVMLPPAQIEVAVEMIDTVGVTEVMFITTWFEFAVGVVTQFALLVIVTVTISPSASVLLVKVALFVPTLAPFTCH